MKNWLASCVIGAFALALPGVAHAQKTKVTVYTALENDQLGPFKASIEKAVPEAGWNGVSGAWTVTEGSNGVTGPRSAPSSSSGGAGAGGASAFSRRTREKISRPPTTTA